MIDKYDNSKVSQQVILNFIVWNLCFWENRTKLPKREIKGHWFSQTGKVDNTLYQTFGTGSLIRKSMMIHIF